MPAHADARDVPGLTLTCGPHVLDLARPRVMGIVNATPDSFSDGGRFPDHAGALAHARQLLADGADIVDVGGESTRPGAAPVSDAEEMDRVLPVIEALARDGAIVSVDTMKPSVMRAAVAAGAAMINDVRALQAPGALEAAASTHAAICLMHMRGAPATMQQAPHYDDVVGEVRAFLVARAQACERAGIARDRIVVDPGFGFGKTARHNFTLLRELAAFVDTGYPVLCGWSRKSSLGAVTGRDTGERLAASLAAALASVARGASIVRVHDVRETVDALKVWQAAGAPRAAR
ncbi:MAG TPA: dihydropteroate synthase [Casimicrobiaceae bacterium]|nr:dihydropteroate synthase [Casimicrobiaceae bacterium]